MNIRYKLQAKNYKIKAQSLIEILVAIAVGVILIGSSAILIGVSLNSYNMIRQHLQANFLIRQEAEAIQALAHNNWHSIANLEKQSDYQINLSEDIWTIDSGQEIDNINNVSYKRHFQIYDVNRDGNGNIVQIGNDDPNTLKITIFLEYGNDSTSTSISFYLVRSFNNQVFHQSDWSGGDGQEGPIPNPGNRFASAENINFNTEEQITMATTTSGAELVSSILDTGIDGGAEFNSLLWQGDSKDGNVKFQIAFSNSLTGSWTYYGPNSTEDWYQPNPNSSYVFPINGNTSPQNKRYIRYKINLSTTGISPQINDIIINWSP